MIVTKRYIPAQRSATGNDIRFWQPYRKGYIVMDYDQALEAMARRYGRQDPPAAEAKPD